MGKIVDYTTRKREQSAQRLMRCPACGLIGHKRNYKDGTIAYDHVVELRQLGRLGVLTVIKDQCYIPARCQTCPKLSNSKAEKCWLICQKRSAE